MELLREYHEKIWMLDIIAYFLWTDSDCFPMSFKDFAGELYQSILRELVKEYRQGKRIQKKEQYFHGFDSEIRQLGELFYLEQRIKQIERREG